MAVETPRALHMTRHLDAAPERVFDAWITFLPVRSESLVNIAIDPRPGGTWTFTDRRDGVDYTANGEFPEVDPPRRSVYTFSMPQFSPNSDTITVEIAPEGSGSLVTFTQEGIDIAEELRQLAPGETGGSEMGWSQGFDVLAAALREE